MRLLCLRPGTDIVVHWMQVHRKTSYDKFRGQLLRQASKHLRQNQSGNAWIFHSVAGTQGTLNSCETLIRIIANFIWKPTRWHHSHNPGHLSKDLPAVGKHHPGGYFPARLRKFYFPLFHMKPFICKPGKIMYLTGSITGAFSIVLMRPENQYPAESELLYPWSVGSKFFKPDNFVLALQISRCTHNIIIRQCNVYIETSKLRIKFSLIEIGYWMPSFLVINCRFGIPLRNLIGFPNVA